MSRVFLTLDETNSNAPVPELNINGRVFRMSTHEFRRLFEDMQWVDGCITTMREHYWKNLANKYRELENVA